jgi:hypothetical protein
MHNRTGPLTAFPIARAGEILKRSTRIIAGLNVTGIAAVLVGLGVVLAGCSTPQAQPCGTKFGPGNEVTPIFCPPDSVGPKFAVMAIGIICATVLCIAILVCAHSLATRWRHE